MTQSLLSELEPHAGLKLLAILLIASAPWVFLGWLLWG